ncbi:shikimate dehydrogenase [Colwellia psychrerythraea]|uniref:Shikimate dehydrogenase (NADP(+)) n=1 Tax=Colwellia psychrerythraea TaxID=28229 RepID=A0A099L4D5_COLPS|nr:shikimate dehydrogenase [Colwellia psychrerythraea]KGJ96718.1 Shikimate dehydrogenase [Colwellia psychrerythraea]
MTKITPDQYRVFGNPIEHSRSPDIHHIFASKSQQIINYQKQLVAIDGFSAAVTDFIHQGGKGANVTVPFKEQALALADELTERASLAGAVNTLTFEEGKIFGDNTDGEGLVQDLLMHGVILKQSKILILGAGGAVRGVLLPMLAQNPNVITIANRTVSKAKALCRHFDDERLSACSFDETIGQKFDLIINATSASLSGDLPSIPASIITNEIICYDMVYGKNETAFIQWAKAQGAKQVIDGLGMLVGQAAVSFAIWRGITPNVKPVIEKLRATLNKT